MTEQGNQNIGAGLRAARERSGVSLRQIADATKLSVRSLEALEQNRIAQLPGGIYRRAIVRAYASEIGLDPEKTLRTFLAQYPDEVPSFAPSPRAPALPERTMLRAAIRLLGALVPILAGVFYVAQIARGSDVPRQALDAPSPRATDLSERQHPAVAVATGGLPMSALEDGSVSMMISVSSPTALQVVADGREVVARRLEAGEVFRLDLGADVVLRGDNAGAVHFSINGRAGRTLGAAGMPLNIRIMRNGYQEWLIQP